MKSQRQRHRDRASPLRGAGDGPAGAGLPPPRAAALLHQHHLPMIDFDMPPLPDTTVVWLVWDQLIRLLLAARGWKFDEQGRRLHKTVVSEDGTVETVWDRADPAEVEEFEAIERFIFLYFYSGTRNANNRDLGWGFADSRLPLRRAQNAPPRGRRDPDHFQAQGNLVRARHSCGSHAGLGGGGSGQGLLVRRP